MRALLVSIIVFSTLGFAESDAPEYQRRYQKDYQQRSQQQQRYQRAQARRQRKPTAVKGPEVDFSSEDVFMDVPEGVRSKHFVRRLVLSTAVHESSRFQFNRPYLAHLMGFNAVYQTTNFAKYLTGIQGVAGGYVFTKGHAVEVGLELSSISSVYAGYRYIIAPETFSLWPFVGIGGGSEISFLALAEGPPEAQTYSGRKQMGFVNLGFMIPLVDVGLRAELRANFFGFDRLILTQGIGAVLFL